MEDQSMSRRDAAKVPCLSLALAAGLAGCQGSGINTIKADRDAVEKIERANSDRPSPPSKNSRKRPDYNDLSPKLRSPKSKGGEAKP
jgi:hypothetical protein